MCRTPAPHFFCPVHLTRTYLAGLYRAPSFPRVFVAVAAVGLFCCVAQRCKHGLTFAFIVCHFSFFFFCCQQKPTFTRASHGSRGRRTRVTAIVWSSLCAFSRCSPFAPFPARARAHGHRICPTRCRTLAVIYSPATTSPSTALFCRAVGLLLPLRRVARSLLPTLAHTRVPTIYRYRFTFPVVLRALRFCCLPPTLAFIAT